MTYLRSVGKNELLDLSTYSIWEYTHLNSCVKRKIMWKKLSKP